MLSKISPRLLYRHAVVSSQLAERTPKQPSGPRSGLQKKVHRPPPPPPQSFDTKDPEGRVPTTELQTATLCFHCTADAIRFGPGARRSCSMKKESGIHSTRALASDRRASGCDSLVDLALILVVVLLISALARVVDPAPLHPPLFRCFFVWLCLFFCQDGVTVSA